MIWVLLVAYATISVALAARLFRLASGTRESAYPLAIFRIGISLVMLCELIHIAYLRPLIHAPHASALGTTTLPALLLAVDAIALIFLLFGYKACLSAWVHYVLSVLIYGTTTDFEYHMDKVYVPLSLLLALSPVAQVLSVDARKRLRHTSRPPISAFTVPSFYSTMLIFWCIGVVYADSVLYKLTSQAWLTGLGLWTPASQPGFALFQHTYLLDQRWIVVLMGYVTLLFEALFIVLMWWRRARLSLILLGVFLHLGIALVFPIPFFGVAMSLFYILLLPDSLANSPLRRLGFSDDDIVAATTRTPALRSLPRRRWIALLAVMIACQGVSSAAAPLVRTTLTRALAPGVPDSASPTPDPPHRPPEIAHIEHVMKRFITKFSRPLLGIAPHGVFLDSHMTPTGHNLAILYRSGDSTHEWLPLTRPSGQPALHPMVSGRMWCYWFFRVSQAPLESHRQRTGFQHLTAFWARRNHHSLDHLDFVVLQKPCVAAFKWRRHHLTNQIEQPWHEIARIQWRNKQCSVTYEEAPRAANK